MSMDYGTKVFAVGGIATLLYILQYQWAAVGWAVLGTVFLVLSIIWERPAKRRHKLPQNTGEDSGSAPSPFVNPPVINDHKE